MSILDVVEEKVEEVVTEVESVVVEEEQKVEEVVSSNPIIQMAIKQAKERLLRETAK